jgi:hypothetical protein
MSLSTRFIAFALLAMYGTSHACVVGPKEVEPSPDLGFVYELAESELCKDCSMISISVPEAYEGVPSSHATFSVFSGGELLAKSVTSLNDNEFPREFVGIVRNSSEVTYEIEIHYGASRCTRYKFIYGGGNGGS